MTMRSTLTAAAAVDEIAAARGPIPWDDARGALETAGGLLEDVAATPGLVSALVTGIGAERAPGVCEAYPCMDKLVLWRSADGATRLRLHVFSAGYADRPHNHRWNFVSRILRGTYQHTLYGSEADVLPLAQRGERLQPVFTQPQLTGSAYYLENSMVHALEADATAVSLLLRGPAVKDQYFSLVRDPSGDGDASLVWSTGSAAETPEEQTSKAMSPARFDEVVALLRQVDLV
jgi:hypothetical protein